MTWRRGRMVPVLAAALLCQGAVASGPDPGPPPEEPLPSPIVETATSELVLIEVYGRDRAGRLVRDLVADDLILKIDQQTRPKPIVSLEFVEPPRRARDGGAEPGPTAAEPSGQAPLQPPARVSPTRHDWPRRFLLFFEDSTSSPTSMKSARRAAEAFLARPGQPTDQFALVSYQDKRKLEVLHDFTSDREALVAALRKSLEDPGWFSDFTTERDTRHEEIRLLAANPDTMPAEVEAKIRDYASEDAMRMSRVLIAMRMLVDGLAPWPGYKALVFIGDGIPENPAQDWGLNDPRRALTDDLSGLAFAAAASNVTLDAVQTEGTTAGSAAQVGAASRRTNALATLALDTGGVNRTGNDLAAGLDDAQAEAEGYYVLAYQPEGPPDGRLHTVSIKAKRKGLVFRYRRSFTRFTPSQARERAIQAAYLAPDLHGDLGLDLVAVTGPESAKDRVVDLVIYVPAGRVLFLPQPGGAASRLDVGLVALDAHGRETLRLARRVRVSVSAARAVSGGPLALDFFSRVHLPPGSQTITAVIADVQSGTLGAARTSLDATGTEPAAVLGLSLYAVAESSLWLEIEAHDSGAAETELEHTVGPALRSRFMPGEQVACGFRMAAAGARGTPAVSLAILRSGEEVRRRAVPADPRAPDRGHGTPGPGAAAPDRAGDLRLHADVPIDGLADGVYELRIEMNRAGAFVEAGHTPFRIAPRRSH